MKSKILVLIFLVCATACSKSKSSIYAGLGDEEDGVIGGEVTDEGDDDPVISDVHDAPKLILPNELTTSETALIKKWHKSQSSKISFIIVDAEKDQIKRTYRSETPRRLASVTKIPTSLSALEHVDGISISKVKAMLKSSNNSEASRYLRLAVKAMENFIVAGTANPNPHSCPSSASLKNEYPAAAIVLKWLKSEITDVDWAGGALKDGAGCDYGNFMTSLQMANVLKFADSKGKAFGGMNYEELLSISGVDGTWAGHNTDAKGRVLAKTGTLSANSNLAGYFYAKRGNKMHKYYFTVFVEKSSSESSANMRSMIEGLVRYWINYYNVNEGESIAAL